MNSQTTEIGIALLRVSLGIMFLAHGLLKVMVYGLDGTLAFFDSVGLPGALAYLTIGAEVAGGIALVLGLWTRVVSIALLPILIGAAVVHWANGWVFSSPGGGWEYPVFLAAATVSLALLGSGKWSLGPIARDAG